jgi:SAM-dependent methyltransferase
MALAARQNHEQVKVIEALSVQVAELQQRAAEPQKRIAELQQHVSRLEFAKSNRTELDALSADYDSILAAKPDRHEVSHLAAKLKALETEGLKELPALIERVEQLSGSFGRIEQLSVSVEQLNKMGAAKAEQGDLKAVDEKVLIAAQQITALRQDLQDFHRRLGVFLEQAKLRMPEPFTADQLKEMAVKGRDFSDSLYLAFEDHFRGSFDAVRDGLKVYLPYVREAVQRTEGAPVLDIACGRGEWLDLLREERIQACGVDLNGAAIELCQQRGLEVAQEDAFAYLRKQQKNSFSAVTSFHFIEHLDYRSWITLIDEALRILKPGGIAVFETPNARNILTTSGDFYRDPTHTRPVFPETIEVIAELRGFFDSKVYCFDENRSALSLLAQHRFDTLQDYVSVSRDAVWVGIKS